MENLIYMYVNTYISHKGLSDSCSKNSLKSSFCPNSTWLSLFSIKKVLYIVYKDYNQLSKLLSPENALKNAEKNIWNTKNLVIRCMPSGGRGSFFKIRYLSNDMDHARTYKHVDTDFRFYLHILLIRCYKNYYA